jgi:hypothetical protein
MKKFELKLEYLKPINEFKGMEFLSILRIEGKSNIELKNNIHHMETLISYFNIEYKWNGMFNLEDVWNRNKNGDELFILFYRNQPIGYRWINKLDKKICLAYNLYVTKIIERPVNSAIWFLVKSSEILFNNYDKITCEAEDWNYAAHNVFLKIGYKIIKTNLI